MSLRAGIVGHRGYSGAELVRLLAAHPHITPVLMEHREDLAAAPQVRRQVLPESVAATPEAAREARIDVVLLATPPEVSLALTPPLLAASLRVIDLSGAFRLRTPDAFQQWYGAVHPEPALLAEAVYGLPEFYRKSIPGARLVANPGCYPTAANLALRPLLQAGCIDRTAGIVCDAKSGVSGAGRKPSLKTSFSEVTENFSAYSILGHRHVPEVLLHAGLDAAEFSFTAQLLPLHRGILETIYFRTGGVASTAALLDIYEQQYAGEPFVRLFESGQPDLRGVTRTNFCDIGVTLDAATGRGVVVVAIDNLVKGAAGQAVQNLNLLLGLPESEGLL